MENYFSGKSNHKKNLQKKKIIEENRKKEKSHRKKYTCAICSKLFKHCDSFTKHLRCHLKPQNVDFFPFKCNICNKTFSKRQNMNTHRALIHGVLEL